MIAIQDVDDLSMAFGGDTHKLLPPWKDIPEQFKAGHTEWNSLVSAWFFGGLKNLKLTPKAGVDTAKALRHIKAVIVSFEPKHEHKEAGCAYLLSEWFTDATWESAKVRNGGPAA